MVRPELTIELPDLHEKQQEILNDNTRFKIVVAGRRWGKTRLGIAMAIKYALEGGRVWWIAPTYPMAMEGWREFRQIVSDLPCEILEAQKLVTFAKGSLQIESGDNPQRLRGAGLDFVVLDECAYIKEEIWAEVIRPTLTEKQGHALFISTPRGFNWFSRLVERAESNKDWNFWQYHTNTNPFIPKDELISAKEEIGSFLFSQEYEAQFVESGQGLIKPDWFHYYETITQKEYDKIGYEINREYFLINEKKVAKDEIQIITTVDLATSTKESADFTAIVTVGKTKDNDLLVIDVKKARLEAPDILPLLWKVYNEYKPAYVGIEKAGYQLALIQMAQREGLPVKALTPDKDKFSRALPLGAKMENAQVFFNRNALWYSDLERELLQFPVGEHDDQVDALAYAVTETIGTTGYKAY